MLKYWRKRRGLSIEKLAKLAKVSTITIVRIEKAGLMPRPDVLKRLTTKLGITMDELIVDASEDEKPRIAFLVAG
jgi:transcriptional regulator with XRE-family HTH domain